MNSLYLIALVAAVGVFAYLLAVLFYPEMTEAHLRLGQLYLKQGDQNKASQALLLVIKLAPDSPAAAEAKLHLNRIRGPGGRP